MLLIDSLFSLDALILLLMAILANTLSAMAGGGAGLLQLPILLFMGLPFGVALATHKIATVALGLGSTLRYRREGLFELRFSLVILGFGLPGVLLGANVILQVSEVVATSSLGVLTLSLGIYSAVKPQLGQTFSLKHRDGLGMVIGGVVIFLIGLLNGSLTSGTGLFVTLWFVHWFGMDYKRAVAMTMVLVGLFWNGTGALALSVLGEVKWSWLLPLVLGSFIGGYLGANMAVTKGNVLVKRLFEGLTIITGLSLLIRACLL